VASSTRVHKPNRLGARHLSLCSAALLALPATALAHASAEAGDGLAFLDGLLHPLTGIDHALAMIAVGALAGVLGGRLRWLLPVAFLTAAMAGGWLGSLGYALPHLGAAVAASVAALGVMLLAGRRMPVRLALALIGAFGVLHGAAHGLELQAALSFAGAGGFLLSTACLHAVGLALYGFQHLGQHAAASRRRIDSQHRV
jgi:urease accessory protein